ncbi:MAG: zinc ribbon domain-containing protein [Gemmatimonadales bacterium]
MPRYEYVCRDCSEGFEVRASISEYSEGLSPCCSVCGSTNTARTFTSVNVLTASRCSPNTAASACGAGGFT